MKKIVQLGLAMSLSASIWIGHAPPVAAASTYGADVIYGVNFRSEPSTSSTVYRMLRKGERIQVQEQVNDNWLKIKDANGKTGYISASGKYTNYEAAQPSTVAALSGVNFRSAAKVADNKIGFIAKGETVQVIEAVNSYWLKVKYNGVTGCVSSDYFNYVAPAPTATADEIVATAIAYIGKFEYKFGAEPWTTDNRYTDCSAFVQFVFNKMHGYNLPRTSLKQSQEGQFVSKSALQPGDLVFFDTDNDGVINHDGIYIGNGQFVHAVPSSNGVVRNDLNSGYWSKNYITARRVL